MPEEWGFDAKASTHEGRGWSGSTTFAGRSIGSWPASAEYKGFAALALAKSSVASIRGHIRTASVMKDPPIASRISSLLPRPLIVGYARPVVYITRSLIPSEITLEHDLVNIGVSYLVHQCRLEIVTLLTARQGRVEDQAIWVCASRHCIASAGAYVGSALLDSNPKANGYFIKIHRVGVKANGSERSSRLCDFRRGELSRIGWRKVDCSSALCSAGHGAESHECQVRRDASGLAPDYCRAYPDGRLTSAPEESPPGRTAAQGARGHSDEREHIWIPHPGRL